MFSNNALSEHIPLSWAGNIWLPYTDRSIDMHLLPNRTEGSIAVMALKALTVTLHKFGMGPYSLHCKLQNGSVFFWFKKGET